MKKIIGITGGVGTGKSTVASLMRKHYNCVLITTDEIGHRALLKGSDTYNSIVSHFGNKITDSDGQIIHSALSDVVFNDKKEKEYLDNIVHPFVFSVIENEIKKWRLSETDAPLIIETALMFETGCDKYCDEVWGVLTDREIRIKRLMNDRGYSKEKTEAILSSQLSDDELIKKCDRIIRNDGDKKSLSSQLLALDTLSS